MGRRATEPVRGLAERSTVDLSPAVRRHTDGVIELDPELGELSGRAPSGPRGQSERRSHRLQSALENFDRASVKTLTRLIVGAFVLFLLLFVLVLTLDSNKVREILWLCFAWPLCGWSVVLMVIWERQAPFGCRWRLSPLRATPETGLWMFRVVFWFLLVSWAALLLGFTILLGHCWSHLGQDVTDKECVLELPELWQLTFWANTMTTSAGLWLVSQQCQLFLAASGPAQEDGLPRYGWWYHLLYSTLLVANVVLSAMAYAGCDFSSEKVWFNRQTGKRLYHLNSADQLFEACFARDRPWRVMHALQFLVMFVWGLIGLVNSCRLYLCGQGCKCGARCFGLCCCTGMDPEMPRWALLQANFLLQSFFPVFLIVVVTWVLDFSLNLYEASDNFFIQGILYNPLLYLYTFNFYLFCQLPPGIDSFLFIKLSYRARVANLDWALAYRAFTFAWDAYYDDPSLEETSESAYGPLNYERSGLAEQAGVRFVSDVETDTHAHLCVARPDGDSQGMMVISFRGTGGVANVRTDCNVARTEMHAPRTGLEFEASHATDMWEHMTEVSGIVDAPMVHGGFVTAYLSIRDRLLAEHDALMEQCSDFCPSVLVCGHSLGGALATLFTLELLVRRRHSPKGVWMMTFGQPRVGNHAFAKLFGDKSDRAQCFRIVNQGDFIAGIPKFWKLFKHVGIEVEIWLDQNDSCQAICDPSPLERSLLTKPHNNLVKHLMASYLPVMDALVTKYCGEEHEAVFARHQKIGGEQPVDASGGVRCMSCGKKMEEVLPDQQPCCFGCGGCRGDVEEMLSDAATCPECAEAKLTRSIEIEKNYWFRRNTVDNTVVNSSGTPDQRGAEPQTAPARATFPRAGAATII